MTSPESLFLRYRQHADGKALAAVFDDLAPELLLVAAHVAAPGSDPADLLQATFLDGIDKAVRWDSTRPLLPWLLGILVNHAREERRRLQRVIDPERVPRAAAEPSPLDALAATEVAERVAEALASLPRQLRQTLSLRLVHGLTPTEIAHALGCPVATAKTRLQRGMEWLRKVLPAGIAMSVAGVVTTSRGLAVVREVVLGKAKVAATAAGAASAGVTEGMIAGGLVMKKMMMATIAVLCIASLWMLVPRPGEPARADVASSPQPKLVQASIPKAPAGSRVDLVADSNERVAVTSAPPVGSMHVEFVWKGYDQPAAHLQFWWNDGDKPTDLHRCYTDAQGRIRLADLPPADYTVMNLGNPRVPPLTVHAGQETQARIEFEPGLRLDGMVVDKDGRGVAGAAIYACGFQMEDIDSRLVAVSREDGSFHGCTDRSGSFWAQKPGFAPSALVKNNLFGAVQLQFVLGDVGCALRGTAVDADGRGVHGVRIAIARTSPRREVAAPLTLVTDVAGTFATDELAPGEHLLLAQAAGFAPAVSSFTSTANQAVQLIVRLGEGATLTGSVVDEAGQPVLALIHAQLILPGEMDAGIAALQPLLPLCEFRVGSRAGSYRFERLPATHLLLQGNSPGKLAFAQLLQLQEGEVRRCDLVLRAGGEILGRVEDANGEPLENWNIVAKNKRQLSVGFARSAADGVFHLQGLADDAYVLAATPSYNCELRAVPVKARLGQTDVVLRTSCTEAQLGQFTFKVLDATGAPMRSVGVWIDSLDELDNTQYTTSNQSGSYRTQPLPPGRYELGVIAPDQARLRIGVGDLPPAATVDLGTVRMPKSGTMELRFDAANGQDVAWDEVSARDDSGNAASLTRGRDGVYRSQPLPAGKYRVAAWGASFAPVAQEALVVGDRATRTGVAVVAAIPVTFVLPRLEGAAQVRLVLATADGQRVADRAMDVGAEQALPWTRGLLPGRYTYEATPQPAGEPVRDAFTVPGDARSQRVEIALQPKLK